MPSATADHGVVAVVGGGLAGLAAAARLAKMGHAVHLHEAQDQLGGGWAPYVLPGTEVLVDDAPGVLGFPAPWRDLFRKSGRPLEAELARLGYGLVPAPPATYRFADGSALVLPSDRGEQHEALRHAYGPGPAARWEHLVDGLGAVWQALRPLGLEEPYRPRAVTRAVARRLWSRRSIADLAETIAEPHLRAVVRSVAYRQGTTPERAPALAAVVLFADRTFGRWQVAPVAPEGDLGRTSVLVEALAARLALRGVEVRLGSRVETVYDLERTDRVVLAVDPWSAATIAPEAMDRAARRALRTLSPARLPGAVHQVIVGRDLDTPDLDGVREEVALDGTGIPLVETVRRLGGRLVRTTLDHHDVHPQPGAGLDPSGFSGWRRRPGTTAGDDRFAVAGAASPAGSSPSAVVQTGALAAYAVTGHRD